MTRINRSVLFSTVLAIALIGVGSAQIHGAKAEPLNTATSAQQIASSSLSAPVLQHAPVPAEIQPMSRGTAAITPPLDISEAEARQWVADAGYTDVSPLTLAMTADGTPVYQGTAQADGEIYSVIVDSWGNIAGWQ